MRTLPVSIVSEVSTREDGSKLEGNLEATRVTTQFIRRQPGYEGLPTTSTSFDAQPLHMQVIGQLTSTHDSRTRHAIGWTLVYLSRAS